MKTEPKHNTPQTKEEQCAPVPAERPQEADRDQASETLRPKDPIKEQRRKETVPFQSSLLSLHTRQRKEFEEKKNLKRRL